MDALLNIRLDEAPFVVTVWVIAAVVAIAAVATPPRDRASSRWRTTVVTAAIAGVGVASLVVLAAWLLVDVVDVFNGAPVTWAVRWSIAAGVGLAAAGLAVLFAPPRWRPGTRRRVLGAVLVVAAAIAGAAGVNAAYGSVRTLSQLVPVPVADPTQGGLFPTKIDTTPMPVTAAQWSPPADLPSAGTLVRADLPGTVSGFPARPATVYLPPAALVANPPTLPVVVMLSGQPGDTTDIFQSGQFQSVLDAYAAEHAGLAPIVVSPDQLSAPDVNPLCTDGASGNSATYLEVDVPTWIQQHLNVASDRLAWSFGGFSQGGTCTFQIGLDQPDRYATDIAIAAELVPSLDGGTAHTLQTAFGGDQAAYDAISPLHVMQAKAPYRDTLLLMGVGQNDAVFTMWGDQLASAARDAGVTVQQFVSPGTSHDFNTVRYTLEQSLPLVMQRAGVTGGGCCERSDAGCARVPAR